jgi:hypothetical protein
MFFSNNKCRSIRLAFSERTITVDPWINGSTDQRKTLFLAENGLYAQLCCFAMRIHVNEGVYCLQTHVVVHVVN